MSVVLLVDDEPSIRDALGALLKLRGHTVHLAGCAEEALEIFKNTTIDYIVMDVILPRISGLELLQSIRDLKSDIPVIVFTGEPSGSAEAEALRLGAIAFLWKPVSSSDLCEVISSSEEKSASPC